MRRAIAAIGLTSWDRFLVAETYPGPGEYTIVRERLEQAGGTTSNTCAALAKLGLPVTFVTYVGNDPEGDGLIASLEDVSCDTRYVMRREDEPSDTGMIVVSGQVGRRDRTIFWI